MQVSVSEWNNLLCYHSEVLNGAIPIKISKKFIYSYIYSYVLFTHVLSNIKPRPSALLGLDPNQDIS